MKTFRITLFIVVFIGLIPLSCKRGCEYNSCGCEPMPTVKNFFIKSFTTTTKNPVTYNEIDTTAFASKDSVAKGVKVGKLEYEALLIPKSKGSFFSSAYACSPIMPRSIQEITDITFTSKTTRTFNDAIGEITEGENINSIFVKTDYSGDYSIEDYLIQSSYLDEYSEEFFKVKFQPKDTLTLIFDMTIKLSDSTTHNFYNQKLKIKP